MLQHFPSLVIFVMLLNMAVSVNVRDVKDALREHALVARTVLSVLVLVPLFALGLSFVDAIPHQTQVVLVLLAVALGAPLTAQRAAGLGSTLATAMALQAIVA